MEQVVVVLVMPAVFVLVAWNVCGQRGFEDACRFDGPGREALLADAGGRRRA
jgi:hypothetical protein